MSGHYSGCLVVTIYTVGVSEPLKSELVLGFVLVTLCWTLSVFPPNPHLRYKANPASSPSLHFRCQTETVLR